jgi:ribitol 2-dehydrogenase
MDHPLKGKVVVVTGASSGIGKATARALARCGARLALAARSTSKLEALASELGPDALVVPTDVTIASEVTRLVRTTLERFARVDVLFANAGIYVPGEVVEGDPEAWARMVDVNVNGVLRSVRAVLPHMVGRGTGDILVTSSISGHIDLHWEPVYSATKHAIQAFVHCLRRQVAAKGLRVGSIAPGVVLNELWETFWGPLTPQTIDERVEKHTGLRSEDVAEAVVYILSLPRHVTIRDLVMLPQAQDI